MQLKLRENGGFIHVLNKSFKSKVLWKSQEFSQDF